MAHSDPSLHFFPPAVMYNLPMAIGCPRPSDAVNHPQYCVAGIFPQTSAPLMGLAGSVFLEQFKAA